LTRSALAVCLLAAACTQADWRIDPDFTRDEREHIVNAIDQWGWARDVGTTWAVTDDDPNIRRDDPHGCASIGYACAYGDVYLYPDEHPDVYARSFESLALHELGHVYGLPADHGVAWCMDKRPPCDLSTDGCITDLEIRYVCERDPDACGPDWESTCAVLE